MPLTTRAPAADTPGTDEPGAHGYPRDLARVVRSRWPAVAAEALDTALPEPGVLEHVISVCYQASLLSEEGRSTTFRLVFSGPEAFAAAGGPPVSLHRMVFAETRPLDEQELRRLAPAAGFQSSLIGAGLGPDGAPRIWGLIHSGQSWLQSVRGGREVDQLIPPVLMLSVTGPGRVLVSKGALAVAELSGGTLGESGMDVLRAQWLTEVFAHVREALCTAHATERQPAIGWGEVDPMFGPLLVQHVLRRVLSTIRSARHGGTLILLPQERAADVLASGQLVLKYRFLDEEPRRRILTLTVEIVDELLTLHRVSRTETAVCWAEYEESGAPKLAALDEALFEVAHFVAALAAVDGAVVMTSGLELLGFGGEISGNLEEVSEVARALDLEATRREWSRTDRVGTRHRSAYRLCRAVRDAIAAVISRDGGLELVRWHDGAVTCWAQLATGPWEV